MNFKIVSWMAVLGFVCLALFADRPASADSSVALLAADQTAFVSVDDPLDGAFVTPTQGALVLAEPLPAEAPAYEVSGFSGLSGGALSDGDVNTWREALAKNEKDDKETFADAVPEPTAAVLLLAMLVLVAVMTLLRRRFDQMSAVPIENPAARNRFQR